MIDTEDYATLRHEIGSVPGSLHRAELKAAAAVKAAPAYATILFGDLIDHQRTLLQRMPGPHTDNPVAKAEHRVRVAVARLRLAYETNNAFGWLRDGIDAATRAQLADAAARRGQAMLDIAAAVAARHPALSRWHAEKAAHDAVADAASRARSEAAEAARRAMAPMQAIAAAEAEGAVLTLDKAGKSLMAQGNHAMSPSTLAMLRENKAAVIAILAARAAAAAPVVIA